MGVFDDDQQDGSTNDARDNGEEFDADGNMLEGDDANDDADDGNGDKDGDKDGDKNRRRKNRPGSVQRERNRVRTLEQKFDQLLAALGKGGLATDVKDVNGGQGAQTVDVEAIKRDLTAQIQGQADQRVIRSEAKTALREAGFRGDVRRGVRMLDLEGIDADDEDAILDAIDDLKNDSPELFGRVRRQQSSERNRDDDRDDDYGQRESRRPARSRERMTRSSGTENNGLQNDPLMGSLIRAVGAPRRRD